jgi:hypothetical protein
VRGAVTWELMSAEISIPAIFALALVAGVALEMLVRPLRPFAPRRELVRRHAFWAALVLLYVAMLLTM